MAAPPNEAQELFQISDRLIEQARMLRAVLSELDAAQQEKLARPTYEILDQAERISAIAQRLAGVYKRA